MKSRKVIHSILSFLVAVSLLLAGNNRAIAQTQDPPPPPGTDGLTLLDRKITPDDQQAAADRARALGLKPGAASQSGLQPAALPAQDSVPHYFGPYANYGNSPVPMGGIASITVDSGGSGYTDTPTITIDDVYGTGSGATATATVFRGVITEITVTNPGANYSAPLVTITDIHGFDAAATPNLGTLTGGIRKFVDKLAGLTPAGANNLGQYIPLAVPDITTFPANASWPAGSAYYEIGLVQYAEKLHSDLPPTLLRGYVQIETSVNAAQSKHIPLVNVMGFDPATGAEVTTPVYYPGTTTQVLAVDEPHYLGPTIVAMRDTPVRIKFTNFLPGGKDGNLFIPVDTTVMGSGMGPMMAGMPDDPQHPMCGMDPKPAGCYTENRATLHLHGGLIPWISDGTPHQWTTPATDTTPYPKGVSVAYVPDMWFDASGHVIPNTVGVTTAPAAGASNDPGLGSLTFYYNNQQSARLMFYHDHAFGITRLNVYAGEAAGYVITDQVEQDLINGTNLSGANPGLAKVLPDIGIPLVIQDKTFVDAATILAQDPTWKWGSGPENKPGVRTPRTGDLWVPHVYMPAQNPWDVTGASAFGRWMYGPWFWPPTSDIKYPPVANPYYDPACDPQVSWCEPPQMPNVPDPSMGMEAFNDIMLVNGTVYPYLEVDATTVRFRILNAADDRFVNLSLYVADPSVVTSDGRRNTEVAIVPALATPGFPPTWPTDGREGGAPDPGMSGPSWLQIGNEGGILPEPVEIAPQPANWNWNQTAFNFGNVTDHSLLLGTAERADVLVDFSQYAGKTLILYNDAPAAFPARVPSYDYFTGDPSRMDSGGAPTTQPGYGPNTRTVMQIRVKPAIPTGDAVASVSVVNGGSGYLFSPDVQILGGGGAGAIAAASCGVGQITLVNAGTNYTVAPSVLITGGGGTGATAVAKIAGGRVTSIQVTNPGTGYTSAPTIIIQHPGPYNYYMPVVRSVTTGSGGGVPAPSDVVARAVAALTVDAITVTNGGGGYTAVPDVNIISGGGSGATALANLPAGAAYNRAPLQASFTDPAALKRAFQIAQDPLIVPQAAYNTAFNANFPSDAASSYVALQDIAKSFYNGPLTGFTVTSPGIGYTGPTVSFTGGGGVEAAALASVDPATGTITALTLTNPGSGYATAPTVTIIGATGTGAAATAVVVAGSITELQLTSGGTGYPAGPTVTITGGGGTGATANAAVDPETGHVALLTMTSAGTGYSSEPVVTLTGGGGTGAAAQANIITIPLQPKAIHDEMGATYDEHGRMGGMLGLELPKVNSLNQNTALYGYISPPVDFVQESIAPLGTLGDGTQIWKITHNGVDTHPIHFHLFNVQLINRVAWDGALLPPDPNELGWKETVRVNPLEHTIVALRPVAPTQPFAIPNSVRPIDPTMPLGAPLAPPMGQWVAPNAEPVTEVINKLVNYGWEYVWHCHILSHEEMDMMHSMSMATAPSAPAGLAGSNTGPLQVTLTWTDTSFNETDFIVERKPAAGGPWTVVGSVPVPLNTITATGSTVTFIDTTGLVSGQSYYYRVMANNLVGDPTVYTNNTSFPTLGALSPATAVVQVAVP